MNVSPGYPLLLGLIWGLLIGAALVTRPVEASILLSGEVEIIAAPHDARFGKLESNTHARLWEEQQNVVLTSSLDVNIHLPGYYDSGNPAVQSGWAGTLAAGTTVGSYMLHADKDGALQFYEGSITFDREILGIIFKRPGLMATDGLLGAPVTTYGSYDGRGFELHRGVQYLELSADRRTLGFNTRVPHDMDQLRILLGNPVVPEPASLGIFAGLLGLTLGFRRRQPGG